LDRVEKSIKKKAHSSAIEYYTLMNFKWEKYAYTDPKFPHRSFRNRGMTNPSGYPLYAQRATCKLFCLIVFNIIISFTNFDRRTLASIVVLHGRKRHCRVHRHHYRFTRYINNAIVLDDLQHTTSMIQYTSYLYILLSYIGSNDLVVGIWRHFS